MDKQEAKLILSSYTLGHEPDDDEKFEAAKKLTENDSELSAWWEEQKSSDQKLSASLKSVPVPADLQSALKLSMADRQRKRLRFIQTSKWLSMAAAVAMAFTLFFKYGIDRSDDYQGPLAQRAFNYSVDGPRLSYMDRDTGNLKNWLAASGFSLPQQLPPKLLELEGVGCRPLEWAENKVAIMCFNADTVYHLFIGSEEDFPNFEASEIIGYEQANEDWAISKWKQDDHLFVLTAKTTVDQMSAYLADYSPSSLSGQL
ncbi:DUF3379 family protein [Pelagicoccus albus]|uniref:DUF3379 family protein n=1 Tax=Pelagicoccus albus TaxID=415222 RepID=A0A7X1E8Y1_9BACT|nr:DUF3379 family protein [Pelagicoccus albus]MBC2605257.1 DUF3379 family protein [Pelagicoccus albus]